MDFTQSATANLEAGLLFIGVFGAVVLLIMGVLLFFLIAVISVNVDRAVGGRISAFYFRHIAPTWFPKALKTCGITLLILAVPGYFVGGNILVLKMSYWEGDNYLSQYVGKSVHRTPRSQFLDPPYNTVKFEGYQSDFHRGWLSLHDKNWADRQIKKYEAEWSSGTITLYDHPREILMKTGRSGGFGDVDFKLEFDLAGKIRVLTATENELVYIID